VSVFAAGSNNMLGSFFFLSPFTMIIGGALVASPIIIHLINRMRFKRVRWAAMEFLLKAQKRSRKRMIIEQLLLLLMRILLVLALALLLSRLVESKEDPPEDAQNTQKDAPKTTLHIVLIDDSASMADRWKVQDGNEAGQVIASFDKARKIINDGIIDAVKNDNNPHEFVIMQLSAPEKAKPAALLTDASRDDIKEFLDKDCKPLPHHYDLQPALTQIRKLCEEAEKRNLVVHLVGDFRSGDFNPATRDALANQFEYLKVSKVQVKLHDAASPRREGQKEIPLNDNLAIVDFRPDSRIVIKDAPVEFSVSVANYGASAKQNVGVKLRVNNAPELQGTLFFDTIQPNETATRRVTFSLRRTAPKDLAGADEKAKFDGFNLISAHLDNQEAGLAIDDMRYTVVEVREKLGILLIDNETKARTLVREDGRDEYTITKESEAFYLWKLFRDNSSGFTVSVRTAAELEKINLAPYSAVVLCNIPSLEPAAVQKLETFLGNGGGVAFFMGAAVRNPQFYNEKLWRDGTGMFPMPLKEIANKDATPQQLSAIQTEQRFSPYKKLVVRNEMRQHPAMEKLYTDVQGSKVLDTKFENAFYGVTFPRYYMVDRPKFNPGSDTQTLIYLTNYRSIADYEKQTRDLTRRIREAVDEQSARATLQKLLDDAKDDASKAELQKKLDLLKEKLERFGKYQATVRSYTERLNTLVGKYDNPLYTLGIWLDEFLQDPGDSKTGTPSMIEFWQAPELADMKTELQRLIGQVKYGDPFYVAKQYKKGRVLAFMGAAGTSGPEGGLWNPLDSPLGQAYFAPLMKDSLQRYLCSSTPVATAGSEVKLALGGLIGGMAAYAAETVVSDFYLGLSRPFLFELESAAYEPVVDVQQLANADQEGDVKFTKVDPKPRPEAGDVQILWRFANGDNPGAYLFEFTPKAVAGAKVDAKPDLRALSYNFDTSAESDLARAPSTEVLEIAQVDKFEDEPDEVKRVSKEPILRHEPEVSDLGLSKSHWLFLGMLVLLILEQAWAVRLSFHARDRAGSLMPAGLRA